MRIKYQDLEIDAANPFAACKLDRKKYAEILTDVVGSYSDGFVLAINNEWGTGKTTFVKMWQQHLNNNEYKTVYFNAWENDFDLNPIVAIIAELKTLTARSTDRLFKNVTEKGAALTKAVIPAVVKAATKRYFDTEEITSAVEGVVKAATDSFDEEIKAYKKKKESIKGFREKLQTFVEKTSSEKPIIFIIDELDRCRPDYAVQVLEQMKHFFTVPGIVFALSIDKDHLAASVRGFYGTEKIDTDEYLRRFIDLEYSIPSPSIEVFTKYLYSHNEFDQFFESTKRLQHSAFSREAENFVNMASALFSSPPSTLRRMQRMMARTRLVLRLFRSNSYVFPEVLFLLIYLATIKRPLYLKIRDGKLSIQEVCDELDRLLMPVNTSSRNFLLYVAAEFVALYQNQFGEWGERLIQRDDKQKAITALRTDLVTDSGNFAEALEYFYKERRQSEIKLGYLTSKIELSDPIVAE